MIALGKAIGKDDGKVPVGLDFLKALKAWEATIPTDPGHRTFDGLRRDASGRFSDDDLAGIWTESIEDCAGSFGAGHVPPVLRSVEILGMIQSRSWNLSSLNGESSSWLIDLVLIFGQNSENTSTSSPMRLSSPSIRIHILLSNLSDSTVIQTMSRFTLASSSKRQNHP
jgi:hypothetical protein